MIKTEIYLGCDSKGELIPLNAFNEFLAKVVDKLLLTGYTVLDGLGYWQGASESSKVIVAYGASHEAVEKVAKLYKLMFGQDAVLISEQEVKTELV